MKILAISPHPDDVEFSVSGILCKLQKKYEINILYNTQYDLVDKNISSNHHERVHDIVSACKMLNAEYDFFSISEPIIQHARQLLRINPTIILLPYYEDTNRIHKRVCNYYFDVIETATKIADKETPFKLAQVFYYQSYSSINFVPDIVIDVTSVYSKAKNVLMCHKTGIKVLPALIHKFEIMHQDNGFSCSCLYGEGLILDKNSPYCWKDNRKIGIKMIYDII